MKKKFNWKKAIYSIIIVILVLISLILIFNKQITNKLVDSYRPTISRKDIEKNKDAKATYNYSNVHEMNLKTAAEARANDRIKAIGLVAIPKIKMNVQIVNGVSNEDLALAAGTLKPNQVMGQGNYAIAGHRMWDKYAMFSPIFWKARVGQKIYLTDLNNIYEYKATERKFISPSDVSVVNDVPGKRLITLITCDSTGQKRLMLRGKYVKKYSWKKAPNKIKKAFAYKQKIDKM
ncbi:MAG: class A sortase [Firmicutes bacterium]|uniref:Class A sortase n=1 Tax=Candidatus Gallilactobacillus intestinavium TaxID=2840838 RepID=A0A9D9E4H9_9LACO|nr:class A sortase [Candidatus Gallilactobacillus intestinavium]